MCGFEQINILDIENLHLSGGPKLFKFRGARVGLRSRSIVDLICLSANVARFALYPSEPQHEISSLLDYAICNSNFEIFRLTVLMSVPRIFRCKCS